MNGTQQALDLTARILLNAGDRVVMEDRNYAAAREVSARWERASCRFRWTAPASASRLLAAEGAARLRLRRRISSRLVWRCLLERRVGTAGVGRGW